MMKIRLNHAKNIGKVIFIVEGSKYELNVLKRIFTKIFNYQVVVKKNYDDKVRQYNSIDNDYSRVFIINARQSAIKHIDPNGDQYLDEIFQDLIENYKLSLDNASIYYIYDRDPQTNKDVELINKLHRVYHSALDNSDGESKNRAGLLLLSYPSFEAFTISNFLRDSYIKRFSLGKDVKQFCARNKFIPNNLSGDSLKHALHELYSGLNAFGIDELDLDDMKNVNNIIFEKQENLRHKENGYSLLSLFIIALLDLGILEFEE